MTLEISVEPTKVRNGFEIDTLQIILLFNGR